MDFFIINLLFQTWRRSWTPRRRRTRECGSTSISGSSAWNSTVLPLNYRSVHPGYQTASFPLDSLVTLRQPRYPQTASLPLDSLVTLRQPRYPQKAPLPPESPVTLNTRRKKSSKDSPTDTFVDFQGFSQCCGSVSVLIWLSWVPFRTGNADPDPGAWKMTKINKWTWFPAIQKGFCTFVGIFWPCYRTYC